MNIFKHSLLFSLLVFSVHSHAQSFLDADSTGDAYNRITSKKFGYETPDCIHQLRHITEIWDYQLKKFVFAFALHSRIDNDRCINNDRQRTEIKTSGSSPDSMKIFFSETLYERWKFRIDQFYKPSPNFCHIHQLKAGDGPNDGLPLITISLRRETPDKLQIVYYSPAGNERILEQVDLSRFKGIWVEVFEKVTVSDSGSYSLVIKSVGSENTLLAYSNKNLDLWREGSTFIRPKWGIYRSLKSPSYLRDEIIRFADFSMIKRNNPNLPIERSALDAVSLPGNRIKLSWTVNVNNEDQFRINRSEDGANWSYLTSVSRFPLNKWDHGVVSYVDTLKQYGTYYYKVRSENTFGNSFYSNAAGCSLSSSDK